MPKPNLHREALAILLVHALAALPLMYLGYLVLHAQLGADPVQRMTHFSGWWALSFLLLSLAMTPLRQLTGIIFWIRIRRLLGLWCFAFACVHLAVFFVFDLRGRIAEFFLDVQTRPFIVLGLLSWLCLLPLALTSTRSMMRKLGRRWQQLHRLSYVAALLALLHFYLLTKADFREVAVFASIFLVLMLFRWPLRGLFSSADSKGS